MYAQKCYFNLYIQVKHNFSLKENKLTIIASPFIIISPIFIYSYLNDFLIQEEG